MFFETARRSCLLVLFARRHGELTALHASTGALWAITTAPDIVHSCIDDVVGDVARYLAAAAFGAYTRVWALLASAASAIATCRRYYSPASIYARLVAASSVALTTTLDQLGRTLVKLYIEPGARFSGPQSSVDWEFVRTIPPALGGFGGSLPGFLYRSRGH